MVDVRSILDGILGGAGRQQGQAAPTGRGGIEDILGQLGGGRGGSGGGLDELLRNILGGERGATEPRAEPSAPGRSSGSAFDDLMRNLSPRDVPHANASSGAPRTSTGTPSPTSGGGLGDILSDLQREILGKDSGGSLLDTLGKILKEAASGTREGAERVGEATGAREAIEKMSGGRSPEDLLKQLQDLIAKNKLGTGAALGGLGAVILGTKTGRSIAASVAKIGALALIGGLAYKAWTNHQAGKPMLSLKGGVDAAPEDSPFGETGNEAADQQKAMTVLRAMIAAAASDGAVSNEERSKIVGALGDAGLDVASAKFLDDEFANPASTTALAAAALTAEAKVEIYTAACVVIGQPSALEAAFLVDLAEKLGLSSDGTAQIEAAVAGAQGA